MLRSHHRGRGGRAGWLEWSRLWRKSGPIVSDVSGIQAHSGLSNGCRASHSQSEPLDLGEKGVYSSYTRPRTGLFQSFAEQGRQRESIDHHCDFG